MFEGNLRNCRSCGRLFVDTGQGSCPDCLEQEERDFERVRQFLKENPGATIDETAGKTQVKRELIIRFLRQGRLEAEGGVAELTCEGCGAAIRSGLYCPACAQKLDKSIRRIAGEKPPGAKEPEAPPSRGRVYLSDRLIQRDDQ